MLPLDKLISPWKVELSGVRWSNLVILYGYENIEFMTWYFKICLYLGTKMVFAGIKKKAERAGKDRVTGLFTTF